MKNQQQWQNHKPSGHLVYKRKGIIDLRISVLAVYGSENKNVLYCLGYKFDCVAQSSEIHSRIIYPNTLHLDYEATRE
jgi:hypothetical protein